MNIIRHLLNNLKMITKPLKYAKSIGVNISDQTILLGRTNWGSEPWLITIGSKTRVSKNVTFWNHDGGTSVVHNLDNEYVDCVKFGFIKIGSNCFIGANSTIMPNVTIGDNCIVGACSLVTKDIPSGEVWGGIPAHKICTIQEYAKKLIKRIDVFEQSGFSNDVTMNKKQETVLISQYYQKVKMKKKKEEQ